MNSTDKSEEDWQLMNGAIVNDDITLDLPTERVCAAVELNKLKQIDQVIERQDRLGREELQRGDGTPHTERRANS